MSILNLKKSKTIHFLGRYLESKIIKRRLFFGAFIILIGLVPMLVSCSTPTQTINLTEEEQSFLEDNPTIRLGVDPNFVPFEFIDVDGNYKGIAADYLSIISQRTGLKFEVEKNKTWPEAYQMAVDGDLDALPSIGITPEREQYFLFSDPYYNFKRVIATRDTTTNISSIDDLDGLSVAVQRNSSHHSYLMSYSNINLSLFDSVEAALTAVATGEEIAFIGNLATTNYLTRQNGIPNLRLISFEAEIAQSLYFAVRKELPLLVSIFNKALKTITDTEKQAINKKWIGLNLEVNYGPIIRISIMIGTLVFAVLAISFYWIVRLKKEVHRRQLVQVDLENAKKEAEEANNFKSSFMARMSHEIRTPLNAITGMSYLLKKTNITLTQKMYADTITQASSSMLGIINDILDFSKIEAGKVELENVIFDLDQVIQEVVNIVAYKIEEQGINFKLVKDPNVPTWFKGDPKRVEQILLNLLNNAAKFTNKGEICLEVRLSSIENDVYRLAFSVQDTGIGMDEEQVKKLFVPFNQGDSSITRRFGGSGLGLSIVKNLVDLMGGDIQIFSTLGEGSTFVVNLSFALDKAKEEIYRKSLSSEHWKNIKVLVLEKSAANMNLICNYLNSFGLACELTSSQTSAIDLLQTADGNLSKSFDLLIVDYDTPEEGGFAFVDVIINNEKIINKPKFIMLLPVIHADLFDQLDMYGVDIGIGKPIIPSILFNGISEIFKKKTISENLPKHQETKTIQNAIKANFALIVEDNKTNQLIAKKLLEQIGVDSLLVENGQEAVDVFKENADKIRLILMDLHMPVMNGYDAARIIRNQSADVPIIALTADVILGVKEQCAENGIYHYISKPFDPDKFLETIKNIISKSPLPNMDDNAILDARMGLMNMGNNVSLYQQILEIYLSENQNTTFALTQAIGEKRYDEAALLIHKMKSSSGSIGAKSLYELAKKLQKALENNNEDEINYLFKDFKHQLKKLLEEITDYRTMDHQYQY